MQGFPLQPALLTNFCKVSKKIGPGHFRHKPGNLRVLQSMAI